MAGNCDITNIYSWYLLGPHMSPQKKKVLEQKHVMIPGPRHIKTNGLFEINLPAQPTITF